MTYPQQIEDVYDYIQSYPDASIGPWENAGRNLDFLAVLGKARALDLVIEVVAESEEFVDTLRVVSPMFSLFSSAQLMFIMNHLSGDEVTGCGRCEYDTEAEYIDIWWD